jgi:hypothetical protein
MSPFALSLILPFIILLGAFYLHLSNLRRIFEDIQEAQKEGDDAFRNMTLEKPATISKRKFYEEMTVAQGSNFTALATAAWIMLFVALAYFYFLVPSDLPFNFIEWAPPLASNFAGFFIFGIFIAFLAAAIIFLILDRLSEDYRNLKLSELYSFYAISKTWKALISITVLFLWVSILISAELGTIYPANNIELETISFLLLIISECILVWPILEGRR